jgi:hypothetical protein
MKKGKISLSKDGAVARLHNKRISFMAVGDSILIVFQYADKEHDPNTPACAHKCHKGKIRETFVKISEDAMKSLVVAYISWRKEKDKLENKS